MAVVTGDCMNDEAMNQAGYRVGLFYNINSNLDVGIWWYGWTACGAFGGMVVSYRIVS